jgi:hypothetical protein
MATAHIDWELGAKRICPQKDKKTDRMIMQLFLIYIRPTLSGETKRGTTQDSFGLIPRVTSEPAGQTSWRILRYSRT